MSLLDRLLASTIGLVPKPIVRRVASRYVAGADLDAAMRAGEELAAEGCRATFDVLREYVTDPQLADEMTTCYVELLEAISERKLPANVSIKLTAFGLMMDEDAAYRRVETIVRRARELGNFVRIDMEDSARTDATFRIYRRLREAGFDEVGLVLQSYLKRTLADVEALASLEPSYRLCKGIYVEPESIAYEDPERIRVNYMDALREMLSGKARHVGIATHDEILVERSVALLEELEVPKERYEFQMLLGVTEPLRRRLISEGHPLRVYVPYGEDWYGYSVRRLKENPRIGRHVLFAMFRKR